MPAVTMSDGAVSDATLSDAILSDETVSDATLSEPGAARESMVAFPGRRPRPLDALEAPLSEVTFVVIDLETTGTVPGESRIIEVAAAKYCGGECLGTFQTVVNPGCGLPPFIVALTGITEALVVPAPTIDEVLPSLLEFIGGAVLVGHNLRFDTSFLDADLLARGRPRLANRRVDTLTLARRLIRDEVPDCRLATLAARFRTVTRPTHRALDDVLATAEVLHALFERAAGFGILALDDLLALPSSPLALRKLPLLAGLPRAAGVYVFRAADGRVLHVGRATDVRSRVRSLFVTGGRRRVARLLRETAAIEYLPCEHPLAATVTQLRLHHAHRPWFDGRPRRWKASAYLKLTAGRFPRLAVVHTPRADGALYLGPFPGVAPARFVRSAIEATLPLRRGAGDVVALVRRGLSGEPEAILGPLAERVRALQATGRSSDVRFAQEQLRALTAALRRQAVLDGLRGSGRVTVDVAGHHLEFDGGRLVSIDHGPMPLPADHGGGLPAPPGSGPSAPVGLPGRPEADEILAVGRWLRRQARAGQVRIVPPVDAPAAAALATALEGLEAFPT
ncbi:MAG TPA: exonuclease domain-containing protein [Acidimicrobiia bacterium]|nr:exonuclease domain-containing protein [Acidimicrobiia bacterium]